MSDAQTPIAGWYPDPAGQGRIQWWDGSQWTENFAEPAAQTPAAPEASAAASAPVYGASGGAAYATAAPYSAVPEKLVAPAGTSPYTPYIWVLALLPLVGLVSGVISAFTFSDQLDAAMDPDAPLFATADLVSYAVSFVVAGVSILVGVLDYRALLAAGVPRPFHWAWTLFALLGAPVYMIGRSIIVRKRVGTGLAPMIVNLALLVASFVFGIVIASIAVTSVLENIDTY